MSPDPNAARDDAQRRLRYLQFGAIGATVVGLGVFAGLAAAGTDGGSGGGDHHQVNSGAASGYGHDGYDADHDGRVGDPGDGGFFDGGGQAGAVGPGAGSSQGSATPQGGYAPSQGSSGAS